MAVTKCCSITFRAPSHLFFLLHEQFPDVHLRLVNLDLPYLLDQLLG